MPPSLPPTAAISPSEAKKNETELSVSVSDTGIGITAEEQMHVFEVFYQASGGLKDKTPGTGLGLPITRDIIEKHGGKIWVESEGQTKAAPSLSPFPFLPADISIRRRTIWLKRY